jgi:TetR/AcrR family transcriptional regulator, transcriptional repressor for nem operon
LVSKQYEKGSQMPVKKIEKELILEKCWEVLHRQGYYHTSIGDLALEVGLAKAGLLHHFGSKEGLMSAVLDYAITRYTEYVLSVAREDLPLEQRLEKMLRRQNRLARIENRGCFFGNTILETSQQDIFSAKISLFFTCWMDTFSQMLCEKLSSADAYQLAYLTLLEYQGAVVLYKLSKDENHLQQFVQRSLNRLKEKDNEKLNNERSLPADGGLV